MHRNAFGPRGRNGIGTHESLLFNFLKLVIVLEFFVMGCKTSDSANVMNSRNSNGSAATHGLNAISVGDKGVVTVKCHPHKGPEFSSYKLSGITTSIVDGKSNFTLNNDPHTVIPGVGKSCLTKLPLAVPAGWQMSLKRVHVAIDNKLSAWYENSGRGTLTMRAATFQFAWRKCRGS